MDKAAGVAVLSGFYFEPTVLTGITHEMSVMNDEVFRPVAVISAIAS